MRWLVFFVVFVLAGCGTHVFFYKDGESKAVLAEDLLACEAEALERAPVDIVEDDIEFGIVSFRHRNVIFAPAQIQTRDANLGLRARLERSCMASKGYTRLELDRCENPIGPTDQTVLPPAENVACYVKNPDRSVTFVEREDAL
ncbi:MAG: hypothetical protein AAFR98_07700 [Pseudomonadota bacterium]